MPGRLRCDDVDLTDRAVVEKLVGALASLAHDPRCSHPLEVRKRYYFGTPNGNLTSDPGWYIIRDAIGPLYVGTAENLDARLNSENGSRDQFANPQRTSDPERNFIKAFVSSGVLGYLAVVAIPEPALCSAIGITAPLTKRDRLNVERTLNLLRERILAGERK